MKDIPIRIKSAGWFFLITSCFGLFGALVLGRLVVFPIYFIVGLFLSAALQLITGILLIQGKAAGKTFTYILGVLSIFDLIGAIELNQQPMIVLSRIIIISTVLFAPSSTEYFNHSKKKGARYE
ncbi:hypothetical protein [Isobaculum melis]|uniref:Uncharacterized protein n=1 Tax=Isobaculum melis TaxID=142588 RepID=A0A1H9SGL9_9LACT|nr:hypothetical protein [Isobaculum melis]SER84186.1 hypothetical protein SAMN04488559_107111 [Isobaculum melis]